MDRNTANSDRNAAREEHQTPKQERRAPRQENPAESELESLKRLVKEGGEKGAKRALESPIAEEEVRAFKRLIKEQPDELIGDDLNNLMQHIAEVIEKYPNELVLVRLLWAISLLGDAKCLGGFGKSLTMLAMFKAITETKD